jgi:N-glycosylase/DNA lyase
VADLPPQIVGEGRALETTAVRGAGRTIRIRAGRKRFAQIEGEGIGAADGRSLAETARHMLRLDADLSGFYAAARDDPDLDWVRTGAGRMLRSPTVFEDVVKTICTTNCTWSATVRMTTALVENLGVEAPGERHAFRCRRDGRDRRRHHAIPCSRLPRLPPPSPPGSPRGRSTRRPERPRAARRRGRGAPLALPGCGPYDRPHMMLLGAAPAHPRLVDAPTYARLNGRKAADRTIERRFRRYREYAGLAFWLYLTRDWVED